MFVSFSFLLILIEIIRDSDLYFGIIMLISIPLVSHSFLCNLLVVHGILSLIYGMRPAYLLHCCFCPFLAEVELNFRDMLNLSLNKLLVKRWRHR